MDQDKKYGLPTLKKYPMPDADHVRSAIKFFNYVDSRHEKELAGEILARMKEYGISFTDLNVGDENRFKKYLPKNELKHHGILGMKWGIRRYQNPDGSLTAAGHKRYLNSLDQRMRDDTINATNNAYLEKKYSAKAGKLARRGKQEKADIYTAKAKQAGKYKDAYNKDYFDAGQKLLQALDDVEKGGYSWKSKPIDFVYQSNSKQQRDLGKKLVAQYGKQSLFRDYTSNAGSGNRFNVKDSSKLSDVKKEDWNSQHTLQSYRPQRVDTYYY